MWTLINDLGIDGSWLPAFVSLILIPALYVALAIDVHKEYGDVVRISIDAKEVITQHEKSKLLDEVTDKLKVFDLEWWLVGAFGVLMAALMFSGHLADWSLATKAAPTSPMAVYTCHQAAQASLLCVVEPSKAASPVRVAMSIYATFVGLLVAFRFGWARLRLAQDLKQYYAFHYSAIPRDARKRSS